MKRLNFKNNVTKVNEQVFNEFQNNIEEAVVAVSPTKPITNEKVWIQKGKNLSKVSGFDAVNSDLEIATVKIKVEPNTSYTISGVKSRIEGVPIGNMRFQGVGSVEAFDKSGNLIENFFRDNAHHLESGSINIEFPITTPANCDYIIVDFGNNNGDFNFNISVSQIQIEQGSATEYEAYVEKAIYTKNDNGVYEKFYKERQIETVDISLENGSGSAGFPVGFTVENCVIIGHMDRNKYGVPFGNISDINVMLNGDNNNIQATSSGNFSEGVAKTKVVLMKLY